MVLRMASPTRHPDTGFYYFRRRVPADLVEIVGKKEVKSSLGTKDPEVAKRRFADEWQRVELEWAQLRREPEAVPLKTIIALAGDAYRQLVNAVDDEPGEVSVWNALLDRNEREMTAQRKERWYGPTADELLLKHGIKADQPSRERLLEEIHKAIQQGAEVSRRKADGDYSPDPRAGRFPDISDASHRQKIPEVYWASTLGWRTTAHSAQHLFSDLVTGKLEKAACYQAPRRITASRLR